MLTHVSYEIPTMTVQKSCLINKCTISIIDAMMGEHKSVIPKTKMCLFFSDTKRKSFSRWLYRIYRVKAEYLL